MLRFFWLCSPLYSWSGSMVSPLFLVALFLSPGPGSQPVSRIPGMLSTDISCNVIVNSVVWRVLLIGQYRDSLPEAGEAGVNLPYLSLFLLNQLLQNLLKFYWSIIWQAGHLLGGPPGPAACSSMSSLAMCYAHAGHVHLLMSGLAESFSSMFSLAMSPLSYPCPPSVSVPVWLWRTISLFILWRFSMFSSWLYVSTSAVLSRFSSDCLQLLSVLHSLSSQVRRCNN